MVFSQNYSAKAPSGAILKIDVRNHHRAGERILVDEMPTLVGMKENADPDQFHLAGKSLNPEQTKIYPIDDRSRALGHALCNDFLELPQREWSCEICVKARFSEQGNFWR